jgi:hypothetical protein
MLNYFTRPLISKEGLRSLDNYAFHGVDKSWLAAHGLNDYWNWVVVTFVPMWVAPNVLTALGEKREFLKKKKKKKKKKKSSSFTLPFRLSVSDGWVRHHVVLQCGF